MRRIRITVAYDGTGFHGWQVQPGLLTIQGELQRVLAEIENGEIDVVGSGRTDAGVHATGQIAAFTLRNPIPVENLRKAMNRILPSAIRVMDAAEVHLDFHPRFQARAKIYEYRIWRGEICPPMKRLYTYHYPYPLDEHGMAVAAGQFVGEHDFSSFAASDEKDALGHSKVRRISGSGIQRDGSELVFRVRGSGFLKHMVRIMAGTLKEIGKGNLNRHDLNQRLQPGFPGKAGPALPARGLCLVAVEY